MVQQISDELPEGDSAHRAAETHQPGDGADHVGGKRSVGSTITSVDHDCCPKYARLNMASAQATGTRGTNMMDGITAALSPSANFLATPSEN